ncbi:hypothetical protein A2U01_0074119, partial [Trifolium medium]|nr:hypothetical protein [Trifolium medium]
KKKREVQSGIKTCCTQMSSIRRDLGVVCDQKSRLTDDLVTVERDVEAAKRKKADMKGAWARMRAFVSLLDLSSSS